MADQPDATGGPPGGIPMIPLTPTMESLFSEYVRQYYGTSPVPKDVGDFENRLPSTKRMLNRKFRSYDEPHVVHVLRTSTTDIMMPLSTEEVISAMDTCLLGQILYPLAEGPLSPVDNTVFLCWKPDKNQGLHGLGAWKVMSTGFIIGVSADPLEYLSNEFRSTQDFQSSPRISNIILPSRQAQEIFRPSKSAVRYDLKWFREAPIFHGTMRFLALKNIDYYSHRADQGTETSIYVSPPRGILECQDSTNSKCVIIFKDREALKAFSKKLETARGDRALSPATIFEILSQHIIEESVQFLRDISFQIHNAKYTGMKNPTRGVIEYLLLVEDYLREMPELLDSTREWIEGIESVSDEPGTPGNANLARQQAIEGAKIRDENIDYLKVMSQKILQEAKEVKKMLVDHIPIAQLEKSAILMILVSIFVPLSFLTSFFSMYFVDPPMPGNIHFPGISLYWVIAAPITIGTVLLPAFGGEIFQWLVHTRSNYRIPVIDTILTVLISIFFYTSGDAISIVLQVIFVLLYPVKSAMVTAYAFRQDAKGMASSHKVSSSIDLAVAIMACLAIWISAGPSGSSQAIMWLVLFYFYRLARWSWGRNPVMKQYMSSLWSFSKRKFTQKLNRSGVTIEPG